MNINFAENDYLLVWALLYGPAISEEVFEFKKKLWAGHKKQYNLVEKDKKELLKDIKNYIPDDDTIYNLVFEAEVFDKLKDQSSKHRLELLKMWDENKKEINSNIKDILRFDIKDKYNVFIVNPKLDMTDVDKDTSNIIWGHKKDLDDKYKTLTNIVYEIVKREVGDYNSEYKEIIQAVLELAITNELQTRLCKTSTYDEGDKSLKFLKRQIYPYWLMYMGADFEQLTGYMMRDKIAFDIDKYTIERQLKKVDLYGFIDFCIKNQRYIVRINNLEII